MASGTKSVPGASSNMTDFRFCKVQNRRRKCHSLVRKSMWSLKKKKKTSPGFTCWFLSVISMGPLSSSWALYWACWSQRPSWRLWVPLSSWAPGSLYPCPLSSRRPLRKSRYRTGSLTRSEIISKRGLLVLNLQKLAAAKLLQNAQVVRFAFETITLREFWKEINYMKPTQE